MGYAWAVPLRRRRTPLRKIFKQATAREAPARPPSVPTARLLIPCICNHRVDVGPGDERKRRECPHCRRLFEVRFTTDLATGHRIPSLLFVDAKAEEGSSATAESVTWIDLAPAPGSDPLLRRDPDLPGEVHFRCPCGTLLAVPKALYEKRVRCPKCGARKIHALVPDAAGHVVLQTFAVTDPPTGATRVLQKL